MRSRISESRLAWARRPRYGQINSLRLLSSLFILFFALTAAADDPKPTSLFNGKDLTGWSVVDKSRAGLWSVVEKVELDPKNPKLLVASGQAKEDKGLLVAQLKDF